MTPTVTLGSLAGSLLLSLFVLVPAASVVGLLLWTRWLRRRRTAPAFAHWIGYVFVALAGAIVVVSLVLGVVTVGQSSSAGTASQKAATIAMGVSEAINDCAFGFLVAIVGALWLGFCSLVWRGRPS